MADPEITANIGSLDPLPGGTFNDTDLLEIERVNTDPTPNDNYRATWGQLKAAIAAEIGSGAQTGDMLITARDPGAGWLEQGHIYSQAAYPALFGLVGLIGDNPPGRVWTIDSGATGLSSANVSDACWLTGTIGVAVGNNVVWRTTNGGASWTAISVRGNLNAVARVNATTLVACGTSGVILRSTDSGASWKAMTSGTSSDLNHLLVFSPTRILAARYGVTRISTDGGATWSYGTPVPSVNGFLRFSSTVAVCLGTQTTWYRTTDGGASWSSVTPPTLDDWRKCNAVFDEKRAVVVGGSGVVIRTVDAGATWTTVGRLPGSPIISGSHFMGGAQAVARANSGSSYFTEDYGATWTAIATSLAAAQAMILFPSRAVALGNNFLAYSLTEYSFDHTTLFKTPLIAGIGTGVKGYIKA